MILIGNLKCSFNRRKTYLLKNFLLILLLGTLKCPYNHRMKVLLKIAVLKHLLGNCKCPYNRPMKLFSKKNHFDTFTWRYKVPLYFLQEIAGNIWSFWYFYLELWRNSMKLFLKKITLISFPGNMKDPYNYGRR